MANLFNRNDSDYEQSYEQALSIMEKYLRHPGSGELDREEREAEAGLALQRLQKAYLTEAQRLIGLSHTPEEVAAELLRLTFYRTRRIDNDWFSVPMLELLKPTHVLPNQDDIKDSEDFHSLELIDIVKAYVHELKDELTTANKRDKDLLGDAYLALCTPASWPAIVNLFDVAAGRNPAKKLDPEAPYGYQDYQG